MAAASNDDFARNVGCAVIHSCEREGAGARRSGWFRPNLGLEVEENHVHELVVVDAGHVRPSVLRVSGGLV